MEIIIKTYKALPCQTEVFKINGINASIEDFGDNSDNDPENAEVYGCGYHKFTGNIEVKSEILEKYKITKEEYFEVINKLENVLDVGPCYWCT